MAKTTGDGSNWEQEIKAKFGFVPDFFRSLPEVTREHEWAIMRDFGLGDSVLPNKVKELIGLAISAHVKCPYCVYFHTAAARAFGATDDELREASFMGGYTVQFSNALTGMQIDLPSFKRDVDRAVQFMKQSGQRAPAPPHH